jgi:hypothetical protein
MLVLNDAQRAAIGHIAAGRRGTPTDPNRRVMVHFHPDWPFGETTVISAIAASRRYRSQFETAISNGGLTAHPGGNRWRWESRMFGGAYDRAAAAERPVYGALDVHRRPIGAAPRFGSAHVRLAAHVLDRTTCCFPDSVFSPTAVAPARQAGELIAVAQAAPVDVLDDYVEAQVHGPLRIPEDVEALVLDPSHRGTAVEEDAAALSCLVAGSTWRLTSSRDTSSTAERSRCRSGCSSPLTASSTQRSSAPPPGHEDTIPRSSRRSGTCSPVSAARHPPPKGRQTPGEDEQPPSLRPRRVVGAHPAAHRGGGSSATGGVTARGSSESEQTGRPPTCGRMWIDE